jgi:23S rRNA (adenine2503-C2)-methyltransferase
VAEIRLPEIITRQDAADGTIKWMLKAGSGVGASQGIEMVYIPEEGRATLCISSQVGCAMDCSFCSTAQQGFNSNLSTGEIVGQVLLAQRELGFKAGDERIISNVVLMGMGEPLANFRAVVPAMRILLDELGLDFSRRRLTLSTSGLVPQIYKLAEETNVALAVSLHAPDDALRNQLVPINRRHNIAELLEACWQYIDEANGRSVTFEYVMLEGVNDSPAQARALARLLRGRRAAGAAALRRRPAGLWLRLPLAPLGISGTEVRRRLAAGLSVRGLVAETVVADFTRRDLGALRRT